MVKPINAQETRYAASDVFVDKTDGDCGLLKNVGHCGLVATNIFENAIDYYENKAEKYAALNKGSSQEKSLRYSSEAEDLRTQLLDRLALDFGAAKFTLLKRLEKCKNNLERVKEIEGELQELFMQAIEKFDEKGDSEAASLWQNELNAIQDKLKSGIGLFDINEHLQNLKNRIFGRGSEEYKKAHNQVYTVDNDILGRERLPGDIARYKDKEETGNSEVDVPYHTCQKVVDFVSMFGIDFQKVLKGLPRVSSVGSAMDNAYWSDQIMQIVIGKGKVLFNSLASTVPGNRSVLFHEWGHALTAYLAGRNTSAKEHGLNYVCQGKCDAGGVNESLSDVLAIVLALQAIKESGIIDPDDAAFNEVYKIGMNLFKGGEPGDALRDAETGAGWKPGGKLSRIVGNPVEPYFLKYTDWHDNNGVVQNWAVRNGKMRGNVNIVDPHHGSATPNAAFARQRELFKAFDLFAEALYKIWLIATSYTSVNTSLPAFAANTVVAAREMESTLGMGHRPSEFIRQGWAQLETPIFDKDLIPFAKRSNTRVGEGTSGIDWKINQVQHGVLSEHSQEVPGWSPTHITVALKNHKLRRY